MKERESNIELLRIISMFFILVVHAAGASLSLPEHLHPVDLTNVSLMSKMAVESVSIIGVNCFVLISGFFGIRFKIKLLLKFCFMCLFYLFGIALLFFIVFPDKYTVADLIKSIVIFPFNDLWFIPAYIGLYVCTPVINTIIDNVSKSVLTAITIIVILINVILGWIMKLDFNPYGYTLSQMIMLYLIGRSIALLNLKIYISQTVSVSGYVVATVLILFSCMYISSRDAFAYNSPFVIIASVFFFIIFTHISLRSCRINTIASSAFAVYLIHKCPQIWFGYASIVRYLAANLDYIPFTIAVTLFIASIFFICIAIDKYTFSIIAKKLGL